MVQLRKWALRSTRVQGLGFIMSKNSKQEPKFDPYLTLGVEKDARADEIEKAYRKLVREWHPDRNPGNKEAEAKIRDINRAWSILSDVEKRDAYDQDGILDYNKSAGDVIKVLTKAFQECVRMLGEIRGKRGDRGYDFLLGMQDFIAGERMKLIQNLQPLYGAKAIMEEVIKKIKMTTPGHDSIREVYSGSAAELDRDISKYQRELDGHEGALRELERYKYLGDSSIIGHIMGGSRRPYVSPFTELPGGKRGNGDTPL
jgi:curved DNA-binding protein CbpA